MLFGDAYESQRCKAINALRHEMVLVIASVLENYERSPTAMKSYVDNLRGDKKHLGCPI